MYFWSLLANTVVRLDLSPSHLSKRKSQSKCNSGENELSHRPTGIFVIGEIGFFKLESLALYLLLLCIELGDDYKGVTWSL